MLSSDAQAWFDAMAAGRRWERHETEILMRAAEALDRYWQAKAQLDADGVTVRDRFGQLRTHPAHVVERDSRSAFLQAMKQRVSTTRRRRRRGSWSRSLIGRGGFVVPSRDPELRTQLSATGRFKIKDALASGPASAGGRGFSDAELAAHWQWARLEKAPGGWREWCVEDWAWRRFELGEDAARALRRSRWVRKLRDRAHLLEQIRDCEIRDWHSFWGATPLEERRRLIRKAGRPDLIEPAVCERFGVR